MTLGEGKEKVYKLLDEYGVGGSIDEDLAEKMNDFFNTAQIDVSKISKVIKTVELSGAGRHEMPKDFLSIHRIWRGGKNVTRKCAWRAGTLVLESGEAVEMDYFATPTTINEDTPDDWEFEVREDACEAMPFYVAGMALSADLVQDAGLYFELYERAKQQLSSGIPGSNKVVNRFYGN